MPPAPWKMPPGEVALMPPAPVAIRSLPMDTDSPRIPCWRSEGSSMGVVDVAFHPPGGLLNTYTVPESIPAPVP